MKKAIMFVLFLSILICSQSYSVSPKLNEQESKRLNKIFHKLNSSKIMKQTPDGAVDSSLYTEDKEALKDDVGHVNLCRSAIKNVLGYLEIEDHEGVDEASVTQLMNVMDLFVEIAEGKRDCDQLTSISEMINVDAADLKIGLAQSELKNNACGFIESIVDDSSKESKKKVGKKAKNESDGDDSDSDSDDSDSDDDDDDIVGNVNGNVDENDDVKSKKETKKISTQSKSNRKRKNYKELEKNSLGKFKLVVPSINKKKELKNEIDDLLDDELDMEKKSLPKRKSTKSKSTEDEEEIPTYEHPKFLSEKEINDLNEKFTKKHAAFRKSGKKISKKNPYGNFVMITSGKSK